MFAVKKWNPLYPTRIDSTSLEHRMIHKTDTRKNIRLGIELEEVGYDELSSTEVDEPIYDDGSFKVGGHY